jgi:nicotinic acid mononucleotide adenylyltransferase
MSMVIYLTNNYTNGETRFLKDYQEHIPVNERDLSDKKTMGNPHDVLYKCNCIAGNAVIFNHRILHDACPVKNGTKIIIRTDIVFEECLPYELSKTNPLNFVKPIQDPYCAHALQYHSHQVLIGSGLTNYNRSIELNYNWLGTPLSKLIKRINMLKETRGENYLNQPLYVLINTGCYDPIHLGHVQMMEKAYEFLKNRMVILGGYLVPAHQSYVDEKSGLNDEHKRLMKCYEFTENHDWLGIDPFELLYEKADVNFTNILSRLKGYLHHHLKMDIEPIYVFGSDHPEFTRLFANYGYACCVKRGGYEIEFENNLVNSG